ncbi:MAG: penicillin acylase family protein [Micrococcales bacterium]|nr:MAG: penicillin acylase family protein [Micrococcales bacterium]
MASALTIRRALPDYSGTVPVPGLTSSVKVQRDELGVPHVFADNAADLFFAQGYVQAQDRFFQMDYRRHLTAGRLSELVGADEEALASDIAVRTMGWRRVAEEELQTLSPQSRQYLQSYADGVNAYIGDRSPSELSASYVALELRVDLPRIEPWSPVDSLAWLKAVAWELRGGYTAELGRGLAYGAVNGQINLVNTLFPSYPYDQHSPVLRSAAHSGTAAGVAAEATAALAEPAAQNALDRAGTALSAIPGSQGVGAGVGSNAVVVSGQHTESGLPLLANDPHLRSGVPGLWTQVGLHCREVDDDCPFDVSGFTFAGYPGVVIGQNSSIAWGFAHLSADVTDLFLEQVDGQNRVRRGAGFEPLSIRAETIKVTGGEDVSLTVRASRHGPLISDHDGVVASLGGSAPVPNNSPARGSGYEVALAWTALEPSRTADALFQVNAAQTFTEFRDAARLFDVPAQNMLYADREGVIGYQAPGRIPMRATGAGLGQADGSWPRPGWDPAWDWTGYVAFERMPYALNPPEGFVVAANQPVTPALQGPQLGRDFDYGYRAERLRTMLTEQINGQDKISVQDLQRMQVDTLSPSVGFLLPYLQKAPLPTSSLTGRNTAAVNEDFIREGLELLENWDYRQDADSPAAAYYNAVWSNLMRLTFSDQLPASVPPTGNDQWVEVVRRLLADENNPLWDDARTATVVETRDLILGEALYLARLELTATLGKDPQSWSWGKLHRLRLQAPAVGEGGSPGLVEDLVNIGPVAVDGGSAAVDATSWSAAAAQDYEVISVPSARLVVDLADADGSTWVNLTGVSGHPWSGHYDDQFDAWRRGEQYSWPFTAQVVDAAAEDTLTLKPGGE